MRHAWISIEPESDQYERDTHPPQRFMTAASIADLVAEANALLTLIGVNSAYERFEEEHYAHFPGTIEIGGGLVARLYACNAQGINYYEPREPVAE